MSRAPTKYELAKMLRERVCDCGHVAYAHWHGRPEDIESYGACSKCATCWTFREPAPHIPEKASVEKIGSGGEV